MLETQLFLALFSRRKVSIDELIILKNKFFICIEFIRFIKKNSFPTLSILLVMDLLYMFLNLSTRSAMGG
mgnify:CR=1 FL=1